MARIIQIMPAPEGLYATYENEKTGITVTGMRVVCLALVEVEGTQHGTYQEVRAMTCDPEQSNVLSFPEEDIPDGLCFGGLVLEAEK